MLKDTQPGRDRVEIGIKVFCLENASLTPAWAILSITFLNFCDFSELEYNQTS